MMRKYERGDIVRLDWLDHLAFREIERINKVSCFYSASSFIIIIYF